MFSHDRCRARCRALEHRLRDLAMPDRPSGPPPGPLSSTHLRKRNTLRDPAGRRRPHPSPLTARLVDAHDPLRLAGDDHVLDTARAGPTRAAKLNAPALLRAADLVLRKPRRLSLPLAARPETPPLSHGLSAPGTPPRTRPEHPERPTDPRPGRPPLTLP